MDRPTGSAMARHWTLDPHVVFLNHGSFGACPQLVQADRVKWLERLEREPVTLLVRELETRLQRVREALGGFLGCAADDLALISNATEGCNTVIRSLTWNPGDEVLMIDHAYNAVKNAAEVELARHGGKVVVAAIPFPIADPQEVVAAILAAVTPRTRLAIIDHVTSPTALVLPMLDIVGQLQDRGVDVLVDGAHAPGMVALDLDALGAAYYTGNCHKWLCAPKGAAFLHVRADRQERIRPLVISHGANDRRTDISRFRKEFDWTGTRDPTPWLCVPGAIDFIGSLLPQGWPGVMRHNRELAVAARLVLCAALDVPPPCPEAMLGSMATVILPPGLQPQGGAGDSDALHVQLWQQRQVEVPVMAWRGQRLLRVSAQLHNDIGQYRYLAALLS